MYSSIFLELEKKKKISEFLLQQNQKKKMNYTFFFTCLVLGKIPIYFLNYQKILISTKQKTNEYTIYKNLTSNIKGLEVLLLLYLT